MTENKFEQIEYEGWDMKAKPSYTVLKNKIKVKKIVENLEKLGNEITLMQAKKAALQKQGIVNAYAHYRDEKYLYLVHPQVNGKRKREYIGGKKNHIENALKAIERYKVWTGVVKEIRKMKRRCESLETQYETFVKNLDPEKRFSGWYGF